jgi:ubiquinone/menaquinone biosynthesis C-methylase UbiE
MGFLTLAVFGSIAIWFGARWLGRGKPCPTTVGALFDNRIVDRISGVETVLDRAGIAEGMRVLDAGCGPGRLTIPIARSVGPSGEVVALDVQQGMLDRVSHRAARDDLRNLRTVRVGLGDADFLPMDVGASFDRVMLVTVLGEIPNRAVALRSLHRALSSRGMLSVTETILDPDYQTKASVKKLLAQAGFELVAEFGSPLAYTLNLRKIGSSSPNP